MHEIRRRLIPRQLKPERVEPASSKCTRRRMFSSTLCFGIVCNLVCVIYLVHNIPDPTLGQSQIRVNKWNREFHNSTKIEKSRKPLVYLTGIVLDATKIHDNVWEDLVNFCRYDVRYDTWIHIISKENAGVAKRKFFDLISERINEHESKCASVEIIDENEAFHKLVIQGKASKEEFSQFLINPDDSNNRIDRISALRDVQRLLLQELDSTFSDPNENIIIVTDLDLFKLPDVEILMAQVAELQNSINVHTTITSTEDKEQGKEQEYYTYPHDAICAAGVTMNLSTTKAHGQARKHIKKELWYYDTFATVFYPDTFSHPLKRRLISNYYHSEDPNLVRSDDQHGQFTQRDIYKYLKTQGRKSSTGNVRVTSCFGGLAIYRSSVYFESKCRYRLEKDHVNLMLEELKHGHDPSAITSAITNARTNEHKSTHATIMRYASVQEERPCEHVVFHDCLKNQINGFDIAINPNLVSFWKRNS